MPSLKIFGVGIAARVFKRKNGDGIDRGGMLARGFVGFRRAIGRRRSGARRGDRARRRARRFQIALEPFQVRENSGGALVTQVAVFFEGAAQNFVEALRQIRIPFRGGLRLFRQNRMRNHRGCAAVKRLAAGGHFVEHGAEAEKIGAQIEILAARLLGRHICNGADGDAGTGEMRSIVQCRTVGKIGGRFRAGARDVLGEAEVENFCVAGVGYENVGGLDVAMDDAFGVSDVERGGDLRAEIEQSVRGKRPAADALAKRLPFEQLHGDEALAIRARRFRRSCRYSDDSARQPRAPRAEIVRGPGLSRETSAGRNFSATARPSVVSSAR